MKVFCACLVISIAVFAHSQSVAQPDNSAQSHFTLADFGLAYPLSSDWVQATELLREQLQSSNPPPKFDVLLAAVFVPKSNLSKTSPFFSLRVYRAPATDCKKSLEAMISHSHDKEDQPEGGVEEFSAAGRDYFRVNFAHGAGGRRQCVICTTANGHLLVWNGGASEEKGIEAIVATLNSITTLPQRDAGSAEPPGIKEGAAEAAPSTPNVERPERVRVSSGVSVGLLIKKVAPVYPVEARAARIQGTVLLRAEISKTGDIADLELLGGPIELAGSAVAAVRQWKYKPYLLLGQPVAVQTQIQVNYQLRP